MDELYVWKNANSSEHGIFQFILQSEVFKSKDVKHTKGVFVAKMDTLLWSLSYKVECLQKLNTFQYCSY